MFGKLRLFMFALAGLAAGGAFLFAFAEEENDVDDAIIASPPMIDSWMISCKEFRKPDEVAQHLLSTAEHRLICAAVDPGPHNGTTIRLLLAVERIRGSGHYLLNPFTEEAFPRNLLLAIYDEDGKFVQSLPNSVDSPTDCDDSHFGVLSGGELRGKYIEISTDQSRNPANPFSVSLKPGKYKFQLIACGRFFMGDSFTTDHPYQIDGQWGPISEGEESRSAPVSIRIVDPPPGAREVKKKVDELKLLSVLEVDEVTEECQHDQFGKRCVLHRLENRSQSKTIAVIDPFYHGFWEMQQPVRWIIHEKGKRSIDRGRPSIGKSGIVQRSLFVFLPPNGVAWSWIGIHPEKKGEYDIEVRLLDGIVVDPKKMAVLRFGDPVKGYCLGGVDRDVIDPDSIMSVRFVVEK